MCSWPEAQLRLSTLPGRRTSQTHDPRSPLDKERLSLTSQRFLSPLDTDPTYRLPRESAPSCGEPWGRCPRATLRRGASWPDASRKGAVCGSHVAQNALFRHVAAREAWGATPPPACGALWRVAQLGKRARATPASLRGGCAGARRPRPGARLHGKAQSGQRASLMELPGPGRDTIRLPVVG